MTHSDQYPAEDVFTTAEAAVILTLAGEDASPPVSKRDVDNVIDRHLFPETVIVRDGGLRGLTTTGVKLTAAELTLRQELPNIQTRRRVYQCLADDHAASGRLRATDAIAVDVARPLARTSEAIVQYSELMECIELDPQAGEPVIRGTGIAAYGLAKIVRQGMPIGKILENHPYLDEVTVTAAKLYAQAHPKRGRPNRMLAAV